MPVEYLQIVSVPVSSQVRQGIQEAPWARYVSFQDPDGNSWVIQEVRGDAGGLAV